MKELDVNENELYNQDGCYHLSREVHHNSIAQTGLSANIGIRSRDGMGNEKTSKVFFTKSIEGALLFLNRNINIFYSAAQKNNFEKEREALKDDMPELYEQIYNDLVHEDMTEKELTEAAITLGKLYLQRGVFYKLDLQSCNREDFEKMTPEEQEEIDYFNDDINEEKPNEQPGINNMHTRSGRGVKASQMTLMTVDGKKSALDIAISMSEEYKRLNPGKSLPVLDNNIDKPLLEILVSRYLEKSTQELGGETLEEQKDTTLKDEIEAVLSGQEKMLEEQREGQENTQE